MKFNIPFSPPDMSQAEIDGVSDALRSGWITTGPRVKEFEKRIAAYCGTGTAVCLNSATAALELTLRILGIGEGDEVITSAYTYTASASVIDHVGAKIVLVDTAPDSFEMDYGAVAQAVTNKTKAIIGVDLGGVICDFDALYAIAQDKKHLFTPNSELQSSLGRIAVISDGAHAFGAHRGGVMCGAIADFTSFSFHAVKNLTTAEGGAVTWKDISGVDNAQLYHSYQLLSLHGQSKDALAKTKLGAWEYDVVSLAYKCNMTDIMGAIGLAQLERYSALLERRHEIIRYYDGVLSQVGIQTLCHVSGDNISSGHLYLTRVPGAGRGECNAIIEKMAELGVACNVHYKPLPMMSAYKALGFDIKDYPNAFAQFENEITLPLHTRLTDDEVHYVAESFADCAGRH